MYTTLILAQLRCSKAPKTIAPIRVSIGRLYLSDDSPVLTNTKIQQLFIRCRCRSRRSALTGGSFTFLEADFSRLETGPQRKPEPRACVDFNYHVVRCKYCSGARTGADRGRSFTLMGGRTTALTSSAARSWRGTCAWSPRPSRRR